MATFYVDGEYIDEEKAAIPLTDMAVLRGYGVFDFLRTYGGKPFHLEDHLLRLQNSASLLNIHCPWSIEELRDIVYKTLEKNTINEANVRLLITGGESLDSITPLDKPRLIVMITPVKSFPQTWYQEGVKIITSEVTRYVPGAKSTDYIKAIMALKRGRQSGAVESIYVDEDQHLLEGTTSNIFFVVDNQIITPVQNILPGITRQVVIRLTEEKFDVHQRSFAKKELAQCSEIFITSSNKEVVPVIKIDNREMDNKPGPVTQQVMDIFRKYTKSVEWNE